MTFLPIAQRELLVRGRQASTYWVRCGIAAVAVLGTGQLIFWDITLAAPSAQGIIAFRTLAWMCYLLAAASVFLTADTISGERRDGTLGFLFLTDLKPFDVVLGKLSSAGLAAFYTLMGFIPAFALSLVGGGITAGQVVRTALALLNATFIALAAGLWVSVQARTRSRALLGASAVAALLFVASWLTLGAAKATGWIAPQIAGWLSPAAAFFESADARYAAAPYRFWAALVLSNAVGWTLLFYAGRMASGSLGVEMPEPQSKPPPKSLNKLPPVIPTPATVLPDRALLDQAPIRWLAARSPGQRTLVITGAVLIMIGVFLDAIGALMLGLGRNLGTLFTFAAAIPFAWLAGRFFFEARRTGELELLLSTPLGARDLIDGYWWAIWQQLRAPLLAAVFFEFFISLLRLMSTGSSIAAILSLLVAANRALDIIAVSWVAMWLALRLRRPSLVVAWTLGLVLGIPWVFGAFGGILSMAVLGVTGGGPFGLPVFLSVSTVTTLLYVAKNILFIRWAAAKIQRELHTTARLAPAEWLQEEPDTTLTSVGLTNPPAS